MNPRSRARTASDRSQQSSYRHPVVALHPRTGDEILFVNAGFTRYVVGLPPDRSEALLRRLFDAFTDPAIGFAHHWRPGDVAVWDEHRTVHRGPSDFAPHARKLHRRSPPPPGVPTHLRRS